MPETDSNQAEDALVVVWHEVKMAFRRIPAGVFSMGSLGSGERDEEPVHRVEIADDFWMGVTPVTQEQFALWKPEHRNEFSGNSTHPAEQVTWHEAMEFCDWITGNVHRRLPNGYVARLPSEAHWEYACRAGTNTEYYTGDGEAALKQAGWYGEEYFEEGSTHPVAEMRPNGYNLYDMLGNVWEWCADVWDPNAYKKREGEWHARAWNLKDINLLDDDPKVKSEAIRVVRGGAYGTSLERCRSSYRGWRWPDGRIRGRGFRICLVPSKPTVDQNTKANNAVDR